MVLVLNVQGKEAKMKLEEKVKEARKRIKELKEGEYFDEAERAERLLKFALFYANEDKIHKAYYRLNKILEI